MAILNYQKVLVVFRCSRLVYSSPMNDMSCKSCELIINFSFFFETSQKLAGFVLARELGLLPGHLSHDLLGLDLLFSDIHQISHELNKMSPFLMAQQESSMRSPSFFLWYLLNRHFPGPAQQRDLPRPCGVLPEAPEMAPGLRTSGRHGARCDLLGAPWEVEASTKMKIPMVILLQWSMKTLGPWDRHIFGCFEKHWWDSESAVGRWHCLLEIVLASLGGQAQWLWHVVIPHFSMCSFLRKKGCSDCGCLISS